MIIITWYYSFSNPEQSALWIAWKKRMNMVHNYINTDNMTPKGLLDKTFIALKRDLRANMDIGPFTHPTCSTPAGKGTPDAAASSLTAIWSIRGCVGLSHVHIALYTLIAIHNTVTWSPWLHSQKCDQNFAPNPWTLPGLDSKAWLVRWAYLDEYRLWPST